VKIVGAKQQKNDNFLNIIFYRIFSKSDILKVFQKSRKIKKKID